MSFYRSVLMTGANGFVGRALKARIDQAHLGARLVTTGRRRATDAIPDYIDLDIADRDGVAALVAKVQPDLVIHLAAQASVGDAAIAAASTWMTNVTGAIALAEAIAAHAPAATVINVSSAEVYGEAFREGPAREETLARPLNIYGRTKLAAEQAFADVLPSSARLITVRPFNHTGPGQDERFAAPSFALQIARIESNLAPPIVSVGNLDAQRDLMDVRDVVQAYLALIEGAGSLPFRSTFNITSGQIRPMSEILGKLIAMARKPVTIVTDPRRLRPSDIGIARGDGSALQAATGWTPRVEIDQTLSDLLDWARRKTSNPAA